MPISHQNLILGQNPLAPELQFSHLRLGNVCKKSRIGQIVTSFNDVFAMQKFHYFPILDSC